MNEHQLCIHVQAVSSGERSRAIRAFPFPTGRFLYPNHHIFQSKIFAKVLFPDHMSFRHKLISMTNICIQISPNIFVLLTKNDSLLSAVIGSIVGHSSPLITNIEEVKAR